MEITGKIVFIDQPTKPNPDKDFTTRSFAIETTDEFNGSVYTNNFSFQALNDKTALLDKINIGDKVVVSYGLKGKLYKKEGQVPTEKNKEGYNCITNLNMIGITLAEAAIAVAPAANSAATPAADDSDLPF